VRCPMRAGRFGAEPADFVLRVASEVSPLEPKPLCGNCFGAFPGEDMRREAVEEPTVVRSGYDTAGELGERVLQGRKGLR
jgi:hypothetical protein